MGLQRVRHDWATFTFRNILTELRKWQHPGRKMPRFLESQRYGSKYWFYHLTCWGTTGKVLKLSELWFFPLVKYCLYPYLRRLAHCLAQSRCSLVSQQGRICLQCRRQGFDPWFGKRFSSIPWRRKWQLLPVFLSRESHGQKAWWVTVHGLSKSWTRLND